MADIIWQIMPKHLGTVKITGSAEDNDSKDISGPRRQFKGLEDIPYMHEALSLISSTKWSFHELLGPRAKGYRILVLKNLVQVTPPQSTV